MSETKPEQKNASPVYKKWWFWVIIVVLVLIIGGAAGSSNNDEPKKVGESSENSDNSDNADNKSTFKVGDTVAVGGREMTIKEVVRNYTPKYLKAGDGKEYVLVKVEFKNASDDKISWTTSEWKMEDSNGAIESIAIGANDESDSLSYGDLAADGKKSGSLVFEVPKDDKNLKIHYQPNMFDSKNEAIIEL